MIKFARSSREGSKLTENATKELPRTGTRIKVWVPIVLYFYVMRRSGAEPEPKCWSKVHEASLQADEAVRNLHTKCPSLELEKL